MFLFLKFFSIVLFFTTKAFANQSNECLLPLEVVVIIDSSDNINANVYDDIVFKTVEILEKLNTEFSQMTVTIVNYSYKIDEVIAFSPNLQLIKNKLISMNKLNGQSDPILLLEKITSLLLRNDFDRIKMAIWLTDGNFNDDEYALIRHHSKILKSVSHLFIITSGSRINSNKLKQLASTPKNLFNLNNLNSFYRLISDVTNFACKRKLKTKSRILEKNRAIDWLLDLFG